tara:strand:+ start:7014 stop:7220 length:207 start_codon:yes stop_codon:yes gene_type:complete
MTKIPKARQSKLYRFDELRKGAFFVSGGFSREHQMKMGAVVAHYNKTRAPKKFVQREYRGLNRIYREF